MTIRSRHGDGGVATTLSRLRSECETCGEWSTFIGRTEVRDGRTYVIVRCPNGDGDFAVWRRDREPLVDAYERARLALMDPESYDRAITTLTGRDANAIAALVASPPAELPLFAIEDLPALCADAAGRWCQLLLDWDGWRPMPTRAVRVGEVLAAAIACDAPTCVGLVIGRATSDELRAAMQTIERRLPQRDPSIFIPLLPILEGGR